MNKKQTKVELTVNLEAFNKAIKFKGWSRKELSNRTAVSYGTVNNFMKGISNTSISNMFLIAKHLDMAVPKWVIEKK